MPEHVGEFQSRVHINDHEVVVRTKVGQELKNISYELTCAKEMPPEIVAVTLHLVVRDICERLQVELDELVEGLVDYNSEWH